MQREQVIESARALAPQLAARAQEVEAARRLPRATVDAFQAAGLLRILQPRRVGGLELDFGVLVEVSAEIARGCGSSAWVLANLASHNWMLGMWPAQAQEEVWDGASHSLISASLVFPAGRAVLRQSTYELHGRWNFASGIDLCDWVMLGAIVDGDEENPGEYRLFLVPRHDCDVHDNWRVAGLAGTASKQVAVGRARVPVHRTLSLKATQGGPTPGSSVNPGPLYRIPLLATFGHVVAGVPLGIAESALALFEGEGATRLASYSGRNLADFSSVHLKVAEAAAKIDAARRTLRDNCSEIMQLAAAQEPPSFRDKARLRRDGAFAARLALEAVDGLFQASGGAGLYLDHPAQRAFRDAHAAACHIALNWDAAAALYGRSVFAHLSETPPYER